MAREIDASELADIIAEQCDIENLCSDEVLDNFNQDDVQEDLEQDAGDQRGYIRGNKIPSGRRTPSGLGTPTGNRQAISNALQTDKLLNPISNLDKKDKQIENRFLPSTDSRFSSGKKNKYIISDSIGLSYAEFMDSKPLEDRNTYSFDPYRGRLGAYWTLGPESLKIEFLRNRKEVSRQSLLKYDDEPLLFSSFIDTEYEDEVDFGFLEETYAVEFKKENFLNARNNKASNLINSFSRGGAYRGSIAKLTENIEIDYPSTFILDTDFFDIHYDFYSPYLEKDFLEIKAPFNSLTYNVESDYNFYIKSYEDLLSKVDINETELPCLYVLTAKEKFKSISPNIERTFSLDNKIKIKKLLSSIKVEDRLKLKAAGQYFEQFSTEFPKLSAEFKNEHFSKLKNILFYSDRIDDLLSLNEKKRMYPMYVDIKFSTDKTTKFAGILNDTKLLDKMMSKVAERVSSRDFEQLSFLLDRRDIQRTSDTSNVSEFVTNNSVNLRVLELEELIQELQDKDENILNLKESTVLSDFENIAKTQTKEEKSFIDTLYFAIFKSKMVDLLRQLMRTHDDILKGRSSYNETVFYRIAKYRGNTVTGEPIQNVYFPNLPGMDYLNYVDTQVKYDQNYTYVVYSYDFVMGNKYQYTELEDGLIEEQKKYTVENSPYMLIVENPFFVQRTNVYDSPPPPPEVQIVSYKDVDDKVLLLLNSSTATYKKAPVIVQQQDREKFQKISEKQGIEFGEPIEFSSDDRISSYQAYRIEEEPSSYEDFSDSLIKEIATDVSLKTIQQASSAAFVDSVSPNKKYYYMFRAIDVHGKPSNPTEIYELTMISENGLIQPVIKSYKIRQRSNKTPTRTVKRFVQIIPSVLQTILNEESEEYKNSKTAEKAIKHAKLGITDNPVWDKKFKIRLVSKQTKKVLDFDVKFDFVTDKTQKNK